MIRQLANLLRTWEAEVIFKSGRSITFRCSDLKTRRSRLQTNELTELTAFGAPRFPHYIRLDEIAAVRVRRVWR